MSYQYQKNQKINLHLDLLFDMIELWSLIDYLVENEDEDVIVLLFDYF